MLNKSEYLEKAIIDNDFLCYNGDKRFLYIEHKKITNKELMALSSSLSFMQCNRPPKGLFKKIKISDINFAHRDASLTFYCHQLLDHHVHHKQTHWIK